MITPTADYRRTHVGRVGKLHDGLDAMAHSLAGSLRRPSAKTLLSEARLIWKLAEGMQDFAEPDLRAKRAGQADSFRRGARNAAPNEGEALALVAETARRCLGLRAHPEQLMAALALSRGFLAEMQTGEGKTLSVGLAAVLTAWKWPTCHVLTANDYLADRDADWLRPFYSACGLSVGHVIGEMEATDRAANYAHSIVYTTAKEITADFLRDRLQLGTLAHPSRRLIETMLHGETHAGLVMRGLYAAIIDEADNAMIDDAVTPLIISRKEENAPLADACRRAHNIAAKLARDEHYTANARYQEIEITPAGANKITEHCTRFPGIWNNPARRLELIHQALRAREFFHLGHQYVVEESKVVIVDESTGRLMPQRTWRQGLHQAIEAKESVEITAPSETLARLSFQKFFRLFKHLSGTSGTLREAAGELWQIYGLPFVTIPTHRPCIRQHWPNRIFADEASKWRAVTDEVARLHAQGRPVLVGTRSIAASEHLAKLLGQRRVEFNLLNATRHKEEADIVSRAGEYGRITIATNMAGRGTDIKLGGGVREIGGLHVLATERHESGRIDRQLFGRAARQGDPGSAQAFVSLDDGLVKSFTPAWLREQIRFALKNRMPAAQRLASELVTRAQRTAERRAHRQRREILKTDHWLDEALSFSGGAEGAI